MEILRNIDNIDFKVLMSGKICSDEISRVKKLARLDCIQMPAFMRNQDKYKKHLKQIAHMNGLHLQHPKFKAPMAYVRRLKRGRRIGVVGGTNKVRSRERKGSVSSTNGFGKGVCESTCGQDESDGDESDLEDERFFFQNYGADDGAVRSDEESFFENMNTQKEKVERERHEKSSINYYNTLANDFEKLKQQKSEEKLDGMAAEKGNTNVPNCTKNWDEDCVQTPYRCVSRISVQSVLSLPSSSLNSRTKNSNATSANSYLSCTPSSSGHRIPSTTSNEGGIKSESHFEAFNNAQTCFQSYVSAPAPCLSQTTSTTLNIVSSNEPSHTRSTFQNNQVCTAHSSNSTRPQQLSPIKRDSDGFIYPDMDILTDDMIKVQTGIQSFDIGSDKPCTDTNCSLTQVKLLNRRVKSAANVLPNLLHDRA